MGFITFSLLILVIVGYGEQIMATVQELHDSLAAIADGVNALEAGIKDLKTQVAAGGVVSQADLDGLAKQASDIVADIADTSDQQPTPPVPPAPPVV